MLKEMIRYIDIKMLKEMRLFVFDKRNTKTLKEMIKSGVYQWHTPCVSVHEVKDLIYSPNSLLIK